MSREVVRALRGAVHAAIGRIGPGLYGVACSGGVDSMALADAAIACAGAPHVVIVTIDHGLQPASAQVADGVAAWATARGATPIVRRVTVGAGGSIEAAARTARFVAFEQVIDQLGLAALLLAHTRRDQAETIVMRIVRGTGPAGLAGMAPRRGPFVRPLLELPRSCTEAYVAACALPVWDDPMNRDRAITRVRVRDTLMPAVRAENPAAEQALVRLADAAREWLDVIDAWAAPFGQFPIDCGALALPPAAIRKRAIALALERAGIDYDARHVEAIDRLVQRPDGGEVAIDLPRARIVRSYARLDLAQPHETAEARSATNASPAVPGGAAPPGGGAGTIGYVPPHGPYAIRTWQAGDRMRPVRLRGRSRKLSDLYIDLKIPRAKRALAHVMVRTTDHAIVWAEHVGIAHGFSTDLAPLPR
ncbi:MAG: tRNA lysidine(34) synthetase TilS [Kofleriaceae bacterium]